MSVSKISSIFHSSSTCKSNDFVFMYSYNVYEYITYKDRMNQCVYVSRMLKYRRSLVNLKDSQGFFLPCLSKGSLAIAHRITGNDFYIIICTQTIDHSRWRRIRPEEQDQHSCLQPKEHMALLITHLVRCEHVRLHVELTQSNV